MLLNVDLVTKSKSGKALRVKVGDQWYGARLASKLDTFGKGTIDADVKEDETYGPQIEAWRPAQAAPASAAAPSSPSGNGSTAWLPFASNTVAHAISAGIIKSPGDVSAWAKAAKDAFEALA